MPRNMGHRSGFVRGFCNLSAWGEASGADCRRVADRLKRLAWRQSLEQIESAVAEEFGVEPSQLFVKRLKNHEARGAAISLIHTLTCVPAKQLGERYGGVSQAAISKAVQRAEARRDEQRRWRQRLSRLEQSLRSGEHDHQRHRLRRAHQDDKLQVKT